MTVHRTAQTHGPYRTSVLRHRKTFRSRMSNNERVLDGLRCLAALLAIRSDTAKKSAISRKAVSLRGGRGAARACASWMSRWCSYPGAAAGCAVGHHRSRAREERREVDFSPLRAWLWRVPGASSNFPMVYAPGPHLVATVFRGPPELVLLDASTAGSQTGFLHARTRPGQEGVLQPHLTQIDPSLLLGLIREADLQSCCVSTAIRLCMARSGGAAGGVMRDHVARS